MILSKRSCISDELQAGMKYDIVKVEWFYPRSEEGVDFSKAM